MPFLEQPQRRRCAHCDTVNHLYSVGGLKRGHAAATHRQAVRHMIPRRLPRPTEKLLATIAPAVRVLTAPYSAASVKSPFPGLREPRTE